jgi:nucleoside-diphosphate kinase
MLICARCIDCKLGINDESRKREEISFFFELSYLLDIGHWTSVVQIFSTFARNFSYAINRMTTNRTFTMIKPDAVEAGYTGAIIKMIEEAGFRIVAMTKTQMTSERAGQFYEVHQERPFYGSLCDYMSSGAIVPMILEKDNAVADFRKLIGATNPANAEDGTIRKLYAKSIEANAIHGSDSDENAHIEGSFFFSRTETF